MGFRINFYLLPSLFRFDGTFRKFSTFLFHKVLTYINAMFEQAYKQYTNGTLVKMKIKI